jgi:hypothetical protein
MSPWRATLLLAADGTRRLLREGVVLRSLVFPALLVAGAIVATVVGVTLLRPPQVVVVAPAVDGAELRAAVESQGWRYQVDADPRARVEDGTASVATDGATLWRERGSTRDLTAEGLLRRHFGAGWTIDTAERSANERMTRRGADNLLRFLGALFAMYGVVFGAGSVARDRDEGTLDAELATALPTWVHGASRWISGSFVLTAFYVLSVALLHAVIGTTHPMYLIEHGAAACMGAVAIGLSVVGRAGIEQGFMAPLSMGLFLVASLLSLGLGVQGWDAWIPVSSLLRQGVDGLGALAHAALWGAAAVALFTWRSTTER